MTEDEKTEEKKEPKTVEENVEAISKTLYRMNGTLMKEGELGKEVKSIAASLDLLTKEKGLLEKMNWNLGTMATALKTLAEHSAKAIK